MSAGDRSKREIQRQQLLEEIRRRAEQTELKRIEEQEKKVSIGRSTRGSPPASQETDERINDLRFKLNAALEKGNLARAAKLYDELLAMASGDATVGEFHARLEALRQRQDKSNQLGGSSSAGTSPTPQRETQQRTIVELLRNAAVHYQDERYDAGLTDVEKVLQIDPDNSEALSLQKEITKAKELADRIREEEKQRRESEAETFRTPLPTPARSGEESTILPDVSGFQSDEPPPDQRPDLIKPRSERKSRTEFPRLVKRLALPLLLALTLVVVYFVFQTTRGILFSKEPMIVVFPIVNVGEDVEQYLLHGLTEEVIGNLAQRKDLRVVAATTALSVSPARKGEKRVALELAAQYFLRSEIAVDSISYALRVAVFDTVSLSPLFSFRHDGSRTALPLLSRNVTKALCDSLRLTTDSGDLEGPLPTGDAEAYDAYLRGRHALRTFSREMADFAFGHFEKAIQTDPRFAGAHVALGWTHVVTYSEGIDTAFSHLSNASLHLRKAVDLGAKTSEMFRLWGMVEQLRSNFTKAVPLLEESVSRAPSDAESWRRVSGAYLASGKFDEALKAAQQAQQLDPRNSHGLTSLGQVHQFQGDFKPALDRYHEASLLTRDSVQYRTGLYADVLVYLQQHERASEVIQDRIGEGNEDYVDYYKLGRIYQRAGKPRQEWDIVLQKAKQLIREELGRRPNDPLALTYLGLVETRLGNFKAASAATLQAIRVAPDNIDVLYNTARIYALQRDEKPRAIENLSKGVKRHYRIEKILDMDFVGLRGEPEFLHAITH